MPERPLLVFPEPDEAPRSNLGGGGGSVRRPPHGRQGQRLSPRLNQLQQAFEARRVEVQQTTAGIDPEQVLVIETIGSIKDFANAVRRVEGFEWMGELELDEITPDEDFYDEKHPEKELSGRLFLVMTNQQALEQLLSLWRRYKDDPGMEFQYGLKKFAYVFDTLKDIRRWGVEDRLLETGLLDAWREDLAHDSDGPIRFEAELWFRDSTVKRASSEQVLSQLVAELGGRVVTQCTISAIAYHAILGELPRNAVQEIADGPSTNLVKCDSVMFFRPVGQMSSGDKLPEGEAEAYVPSAEKPLPTREPLIAVLDGLPLANHQLLADRLVIDDPDNWAGEYTAAERVHGTAMTSLIVHGDLNSNGDALQSRVYARPIMRPLIGLDRPLTECMPGDVLPVDLIHRAVRRLFEGEGDEGPVASSVKIVNLSLGDPSRAFDRAMSPLARLLDWLCRQYQVLFVVSGGNCLGDIDLGISEADFAALSPTECEDCIVKAILRDGRMRRLLSPAESINSVTVGASHRDTSQIGHMSNVLDPFLVELPSPVSPLGTGYRRSVKPDILYLGGRQMYRKPLAGDDTKLQVAAHHSPPGCRVAHPGRQGQLGHTVHNAGTSNAAALVSRNAALCYEALTEVLEAQAPASAGGPHVIPLLKALLVHGASWGEAGERLRQIIEADNDARQTKTLLARWLGYGVPQFNRAVQCTEERATVLGFGELEDGEAHVFRLPLPPSLGARREWRRLTVTLGWMSPIAPSTQKYRTAGLWFEAEADGLSATRTGVDWQAVRRGTVQHEVFEGERAVPVSDGDTLTIQVNCREDAGKIEQPVPYGLVVSLEVAEGVDVAIYEEVRTRIAVPVQVRQTAVGNDT